TGKLLLCGRHGGQARLAASSEPSGGQLQIPCEHLADQILAEAVVRRLLDERESGLVVDPTGCRQHAVRPESDSPVADASCELKALVHQPTADPEPAHARIDVEQAQ